VEHFIDKFNLLHRRAESGQEIRGIRQDALYRLQNHAWPGNIRELENTIERAFVMENSRYITGASLPDQLGSAGIPALPRELFGDALSEGATIDFHAQKELFEREFIVRALTRFGGRINQTVAHAGIPKNTLLRKIRKYEINPGDYGPVDPAFLNPTSEEKQA
jgi:DNA-binding NtrC family response regulator